MLVDCLGMLIFRISNSVLLTIVMFSYISSWICFYHFVLMKVVIVIFTGINDYLFLFSFMFSTLINQIIIGLVSLFCLCFLVIMFCGYKQMLIFLFIYLRCFILVFIFHCLGILLFVVTCFYLKCAAFTFIC